MYINVYAEKTCCNLAKMSSPYLDTYLVVIK